MAAKLSDDEARYIENEFSNWATFLKESMVKKFTKYQTEIGKLQAEICSLKKQLESNKVNNTRLQREKQVLVRKCVNYEKQIAILAVNKKDEKLEMLDKAQNLAVELNTVITHLKTPDKNAKPNSNTFEIQSCDSSTNVTDESGERLVPKPIPLECHLQDQTEKQVSDVMDTDSDSDSDHDPKSDSDSDVMILEHVRQPADMKPQVGPLPEQSVINPAGSSSELPTTLPPYQMKLLDQKIKDGHYDIYRTRQIGKELVANTKTTLNAAICVGTKATASGTGNKPFLCTTVGCGRRFYNNSSLVYHIRYSHRSTNKLNAQRKRGPKEKTTM